MIVFAVITLIGAALSAFMFRRGGIYNPHELPTSETARETPDLPLSSPVQPVEVIPPPVIDTEPIKAPTLTQLCTAMRDFEGGPGDANYRNCNPLNARYFEGGYLPKYGNVRRSPAGFAIFPTYAIGWMYGFEMLKNKIKNHPDWTLLDLISNHAPVEDHNDPRHYATVVATRLGVQNSFPCSKLVLV